MGEHLERRSYWYVIDDETGRPVGGHWSTREIAQMALEGKVPEAIEAEYRRSD